MGKSTGTVKNVATTTTTMTTKKTTIFVENKYLVVTIFLWSFRLLAVIRRIRTRTAWKVPPDRMTMTTTIRRCTGANTRENPQGAAAAAAAASTIVIKIDMYVITCAIGS